MFLGVSSKIKGFFDILIGIGRMERGPQDLPSSAMLMLAGLAAYLVCKMVLGWFTLAPGGVILAALWDTSLGVVITLGALALRRVLNRANQTLAAFAFIGTGITLVANGAIAIVALAPMPLIESGVSRAITFPLVLLNLLINGHIYREALATNFAIGLLLSVAHVLGVFALLPAGR